MTLIILYTIMKIRRDLTLRRVGQNYMVVQLSDNVANMTNVYTMNETAAYLWKKCGTHEFTHTYLTKCLCDEYEVTEEQAEKDINSLVEEWRKYKLME